MDLLLPLHKTSDSGILNCACMGSSETPVVEFLCTQSTRNVVPYIKGQLVEYHCARGSSETPLQEFLRMGSMETPVVEFLHT